MKRTQRLLVPFIVALLTAPITGCGDGGSGDGGNGGNGDNTGNGDNGGNGDNADDKSPGTSGGDDTKDPNDTGNPDDSGDSGDTGTGNDKDGPSPGDIDCSALKVTGIEEGQVPPNVSLVDANGEKVNLHDYCNDVLYVMAGSAF